MVGPAVGAVLAELAPVGEIIVGGAIIISAAPATDKFMHPLIIKNTIYLHNSLTAAIRFMKGERGRTRPGGSDKR